MSGPDRPRADAEPRRWPHPRRPYPAPIVNWGTGALWRQL